MAYKVKDLEEHFSIKVLECAQRLQSVDNAESQQLECLPSVKYSSETFGEELLNCIENLPPAKVCKVICMCNTANFHKMFTFIVLSVIAFKLYSYDFY